MVHREFHSSATFRAAKGVAENSMNAAAAIQKKSSIELLHSRHISTSNNVVIKAFLKLLHHEEVSQFTSKIGRFKAFWEGLLWLEAWLIFSLSS